MILKHLKPSKIFTNLKNNIFYFSYVFQFFIWFWSSGWFRITQEDVLNSPWLILRQNQIFENFLIFDRKSILLMDFGRNRSQIFINETKIWAHRSIKLEALVWSPTTRQIGFTSRDLKNLKNSKKNAIDFSSPEELLLPPAKKIKRSRKSASHHLKTHNLIYWWAWARFNHETIFQHLERCQQSEKLHKHDFLIFHIFHMFHTILKLWMIQNHSRRCSEQS